MLHNFLGQAQDHSKQELSMSNSFTVIASQLSDAEKVQLLDVAFNDTFKLTIFSAQKRIENEMASLDAYQHGSPAKFQMYYNNLKNLRDAYLDISNGLLSIREYAQELGMTSGVRPQQTVKEEQTNA